MSAPEMLRSAENSRARKAGLLDARPAPKPPKKGLVVLDAYYGAGVWGEEKMVDIKAFLSEREKGGRIDVSVKEVVSKTPDPAPGTSKVLIVRYALDGNVRLEMFEEHQTVRLGAPKILEEHGSRFLHRDVLAWLDVPYSSNPANPS